MSSVWHQGQKLQAIVLPRVTVRSVHWFGKIERQKCKKTRAERFQIRNRPWSMQREGLSDDVKVIDGEHIADGFVVSAKVKNALAARLKKIHHMYVWAFENSPLDLNMLNKTDRAIVVIDEKQTKSKTINKILINTINYNGHQTVLPSNVSPQLDIIKLSIIKLAEPEFVKSLLCGQYTHNARQVFCAADRNTTKLLTTPMRDAVIAGPNLRKTHRRAGWYLATEFLIDVMNFEKSSVWHVLNHQTTDYQLLHATIVALMRDEESMVFGVNDVFPLVMFIHVKNIDDIKFHHLQKQLTVILKISINKIAVIQPAYQNNCHIICLVKQLLYSLPKSNKRCFQGMACGARVTSSVFEIVAIFMYSGDGGLSSHPIKLAVCSGPLR